LERLHAAYTRLHRAGAKEEQKARASHRRVELFGLVIALAAVDQEVDAAGVGGDGVRQVDLRQLVPADERAMNVRAAAARLARRRTF
jgi:hypothetical protein